MLGRRAEDVGPCRARWQLVLDDAALPLFVRQSIVRINRELIVGEGGADVDAPIRFVVDRHDSSVRWMQEPNQGDLDTGGFWSWRDARRLYYQALVEPNANYREALWANLFRALGQIMHLVVDASVPEHTRNDMHPLGGLTPTSSYEYWVSGQHPTPPLEAAFVARFLSAPIGNGADAVHRD